MNRIVRLIALLLCATVVLAPTVAVSETGAPASGSISGTISGLDPESPLTWITLLPLDTKLNAYPRVVAHDGPWTLDGVPPGDYRIRFASAKGTRAWSYYPGTQQTGDATVVHVETGEAVTGIDMQMKPGAVIAGTVDYRPGAVPASSSGQVHVYYLDGGEWTLVPTEIGYTVPAPEYRIGGLETGTYRLGYVGGPWDTASGYLGGTDDIESSTPVSVTAGETTSIDFTPRRGGHYVTRVLDPAGDPVKGVRVSLYTMEEDGAADHFVKFTETDADGTATLVGLDTGDYYAVVQPDDRFPYQEVYSGDVYRDWSHPTKLPDGLEVTHVEAATTEFEDVHVLPGGDLEGTVRDEDGHPLAGVTVKASFAAWGNDGTVGEERTTDASGHYVFAGQPYYPYRLTFSDPQGLFATTYNGGAEDFKDSTPVAVRPATTLTVDATMKPMPLELSDETPVVGQPLSATLRSASGKKVSAGSLTGWSWRRDGRAIAGSGSGAYEPTTADHRRRLSAVVTIDRNGTPVTRVASSPTEMVAMRQPTLVLTARSLGRGRIELTVKGQARDVPKRLVDGRIDIGRVRSGSDHLVTRSMRDGSLRVVLSGQPRAKRTYTAQFLAVTDRYSRSPVVRRTVTVK